MEQSAKAAPFLLRGVIHAVHEGQLRIEDELISIGAAARLDALVPGKPVLVRGWQWPGGPKTAVEIIPLGTVSVSYLPQARTRRSGFGGRRGTEHR